MPNWSEGVLKIRGTRQDVRRFLVEGLEALPDPGQQIRVMMGRQQEIEKPDVEIKEDEWDLVMRSPNGFYIKGTRRAFIEGVIEWWFNDESHLEILALDTFKQAWAVLTDEFAEISQKYHLDIKIYTFEKGLEFNQDIEIQFDDYEWECLMPGLGG